jgi:putative membrane protein insertion efficiency factor
MSEENSSSKNSSGDDFCCGCCLGLAVGYMLWGGSSNSSKAQLHQPSGLEQVVNQNAGSEGFLLKQIANYKSTISPRIKEELGVERLCKYEPSCSTYAQEAISTYGSLKGGAMAAARLARCNPLSAGGYDPVKKDL